MSALLNPNLAFDLVLIAILATCCVTDVRGKRIPNLITLPGMLLALIYHGMTSGPDGLVFNPSGLGFSAAGLAIGFVVMLVPHILGVMGAGDVKLMAMVGAFLGPYLVLDAFLATSLFGGLYALLVLLGRRDYLKRVFAAIRDMIFHFAAFRTFNYVKQDTESALPRLCYGVAIAMGTVAAMVLSAYGHGAFSALTA